MDKYLRPERFDEDPSSKTAKEWLHWKKTFVNFLAQSELSAADKDTAAKWPQIKLQLLINHISPKVYAHVSEYETYDSAIAALDKLYVKPNNIIYARHLLTTRKQQAGETIDIYMQSLKQLAKDCDFTSVDAETNKNDTIRGAFIAGMTSAKARSRLLESLSLTLDQAYNTALSMEMAETNSQTFINPIINAVPLASETRNNNTAPETVTTTAATISNVANSSSTRKCWYCGGSLHARRKCPARDTVCKSCNKKGHFSKECRSKPNTSASITSPEECEHCSAIIAATPASLRKAMIPAVIKGIKAQALVDTGSSISFINEDFANLCRLKRSPCTQTVSMASLSHTSQVSGSTCQNVHLGDHCYEKINLLIVKNLCADLIIGHDVLALHSTLEFAFGGPKDAFKVCSVAEASVPAVPLFANVSPDCKPIAIRSRRHSPEDQAFIADEVKKLLEDGIIEESHSPWRAQVLVTKNANHKKRLVIDYSQTVNRYTQLDAYPLPNMEEMVTKVSKYAVFSTIDLQSAYHQVPILCHEKPFTAFEACGNLYQFRRIPFGVTNGVASFQRTVDWLIRKENLSGAYAYLDDITVCGNTQQEHDINLERFLRAADKYGLTLNKTKSKFSQRIINLLGYTIQDHIIKPDSDRLQPFLKMPPPNDLASHRRTLGMFAHYSKWIPNFSERIHILALFP